MRICIPIREDNLEKAKKQVRRVEKAARGMGEVYLEIWLDKIGMRDQLSQTGMSGIIKEARKPVIAVCRGPIERGTFKGSEKKRVGRLAAAVEAGAKFVDVGIHTNPSLVKNLKKICHKKRSQLIISKHFWNSTPDLKILLKTYEHAKHLGADIVKIATFIKNWSDNVILFELTKRLAGEGRRVIIIGMGDKGKISRIGCTLLGSFLTYVAFDEKSQTAEGQWTIEEIKKLGN